jgi:hypothetical protein
MLRFRVGKSAKQAAGKSACGGQARQKDGGGKWLRENFRRDCEGMSKSWWFGCWRQLVIEGHAVEILAGRFGRQFRQALETSRVSEAGVFYQSDAVNIEFHSALPPIWCPRAEFVAGFLGNRVNYSIFRPNTQKYGAGHLAFRPCLPIVNDARYIGN